MTRALILALLTLVVAPSTTQAGWRIERSLQVAQVVWRPSCGPVGVYFGDPVAYGATENASGWVKSGTCAIGINRSFSGEFEDFCDLILHEMGHVAGYRNPANPADPYHSLDPLSVMFTGDVNVRARNEVDGKLTTEWLGYDSRCLQRARPYLERHGVVPAT